MNSFEKELSDALEMTAKALPALDEDDRLIPILNSLAKQYMTKEYSPSKSGEKLIMHDQVSSLEIHFPPCMQNLSYALKRDAHLKHTSRLHYGLFLKGIGLSLEEALIFWRKSFHRMTDDEFNKKGYAYGIRYNYGMEGKRTNYTPYSCMRIISSMPGPGDTHGCPFRHFSSDNLESLLQRMSVQETDIQGTYLLLLTIYLEILKRSRDNHYQLACTKLFEVTRGVVHQQAESNELGATQNFHSSPLLLETIEHPNQFFDLSLYGSSNRIKKESDDFMSGGVIDNDR